MFKKAGFIILLGCAAVAGGLSADEWGLQVKAAVEAQKAGDLKRAEDLLLKALLETERYGASDPRAAYTLDYLGTLYQQKGATNDALRVWTQALAAFDKALGPQSQEALASCQRLAEALESDEQWAQSEPLRRRLLEQARQATAHDPLMLAQAEADLGLALDAQKKWDEAMPLYDDSLKLRSTALGDDSAEVAEILSDQGRVWFKKGDYAKAEGLLKRAAAADEAALGPADPSLADDYRRLAAVLKQDGKGKAADEAQDRADAIAAAVDLKKQGPQPKPSRLPAPGEGQ